MSNLVRIPGCPGPKWRGWKVANRDGWRCHYCSIKLEPETATIDHVVARTRGGTYSMHNLVLACRKCNNSKGQMSYYEFVGVAFSGLARDPMDPCALCFLRSEQAGVEELCAPCFNRVMHERDQRSKFGEAQAS